MSGEDMARAPMPTPEAPSSVSLSLANEAATSQLAMDIAAALEPGDLITLSGDLGAGKTTFTRALIRHLADDPALEVPSPTFTLLQTYDLPRFPVVHADLYRIAGAGELAEIGFDDLPAGAVVLLEWPERAATSLAPDRLDIAFALVPHEGDNVRRARVTGHGVFASRMERLIAVRRFLDQSDWAKAERHRIAGDASSRTYERLALGPRRAILMNAPRKPDGPPVRDGKPYSAIAHLAEDAKPFVAMATGLRARGFSAPEIHAADLAEGFIVLEDLGSYGVVEGEPAVPVAERYEAATDVLAALHQLDLPETLPVAAQVEYRLPRYDREAFLIEAELLLDWYLPRQKSEIAVAARAQFRALWTEALAPVLAKRPTWVLRDYHSPNLLWLPNRDGIARVGLLDFQDALIGPAAYDVASLLQDARTDVPEALERVLLARYVRQRGARDGSFDRPAFMAAYSTLAAQRATKILGIFARLALRDGKPQYVAHMPRIWGYLRRCLVHPRLSALKSFYDRHVFALDGRRHAR